MKLPVAVVWTQCGICAVKFSRSGEKLPITLQKQFTRYFSGKPVTFHVPLDLTGGTPFQQKVWRVLCSIPYGQTRSYGWVARKLGKPGAARAVGTACGANPIPIIVPCHRVIASDGSLGGYSGGLAWKRRLLRNEGVILQ